ncbi:hypothetical protein DVH24_000390 [Malus domestica]|uniref:Uncharacterized protein n=1 Tax=Malus domestica TaxID=3750 RepID=A0A498J5R0_MALDO|nr:hypothetical protein DVH24_000390 [Malus domestica]
MPAMLYDLECWAVIKQHVENECSRDKNASLHIYDERKSVKMVRHVNRRPTDALVRRCNNEMETQGKKGWGRPRKTLK